MKDTKIRIDREIRRQSIGSMLVGDATVDWQQALRDDAAALEAAATTLGYAVTVTPCWDAQDAWLELAGELVIDAEDADLAEEALEREVAHLAELSL